MRVWSSPSDEVTGLMYKFRQAYSDVLKQAEMVVAEQKARFQADRGRTERNEKRKRR